ncbi:MAG: NUDIX domain-containing protein [Candidatus Delongbacteria bacterium]|nr:NUDIX domain-containing protein [Candidatus Delongbacteria bacterium]
MRVLAEIHRKDNLNLNGKTLSREAVRGIIFKEKKLLLIHSENKNYDFKFPGGGIEDNETHEETLKREILEETGYKVVAVEKEFGKVVEFDIPQEKEYDLFKMTSYYYICSVSEMKSRQKLEGYEYELGFKAEWVDIDKALKVNEELLNNEKAPRWSKRETYVLKEIKNNLGSTGLKYIEKQVSYDQNPKS